MAKYDITVRLTGTDGNAFALMGRVTGTLRKAKVPESDIMAFRTAATSGDYNHLLRTCMEWVNVT